MRHVGMAQTSSPRVAKNVTVVRPLPAAAYGISSSKRSRVLLVVLLPLLAVGLLLLGAILVPAEVLPWPEPARILVERRGEISFAGLGILAACASVALLFLFVS
jgi:hypothetical protein